MPAKRIRPLEHDEHRLVIEYFHNASDELLVTMGVDKQKLLPKDDWMALYEADFARPIQKRQFFYVGWELDGELIGHSSVNHIEFGRHANIHLHMWDRSNREQGMGLWFFKQSVNYFLKLFELGKLLCEPCADNPAPNRTLQRLGLTPIKTYQTTPGMINFEQQYVTQYEITASFGE